MMNLYQQQQLQQQQQQLQQQQAGADPGSMLLQGGAASGGMDSLYGGGGLGPRGSLGLGVGPAAGDMMLRQGAGAAGAGSTQSELAKAQQEQAAMEERLQKLKDDIARRQKEAEDLEKKAAPGAKRDGESASEPEAKRAKTEAAGSKD